MIQSQFCTSMNHIFQGNHTIISKRVAYNDTRVVCTTNNNANYGQYARRSFTFDKILLLPFLSLSTLHLLYTSKNNLPDRIYELTIHYMQRGS